MKPLNDVKCMETFLIVLRQLESTVSVKRKEKKKLLPVPTSHVFN